MPNPRIPYAFSTERPPLAAPQGKPILVHLVVNVEDWVFTNSMPRTIITPPHGRTSVPDIPNYSWVEYGMRSGLPRILEAFAARSLPASTSINAGVIASYPRAAEAMLRAGWEFIGHGYAQQTLEEATERETITSSLEKIASFSGSRVRGWLSPGLRETMNTPDILASAGVEYVCDWVLDDLPNWMTVRSGHLLQVPYNLELNDSIIYAVEKHSSPEYLLRLRNTLALFEQESQHLPRVLALGLHPHLIGVPHRFEYLEQMLDLLQSNPRVTFMTGSQIHDWYSAQVPPDARPDA